MSSSEPKSPLPEIIRESDNTHVVDDIEIAKASNQLDLDLDVGARYAGQLQDSPYTREEEIALRWRFDRLILPILFFNVILASVDKTSTSTGAL